MLTATLTAPPDPRAADAGRAARPAEPTLAAGTAIGRYLVIEPLGAGGMSTVYRAEDTALRRQVALKILRADLSSHLAGRERFAREGQAMARLAHPHVATIHDVGQHEARVFLALELCEGGTLAGWLAHPRSWREIDRVLTAAARGLAAAHAAGIVHRDFKPENVLLTRDGVPRVSDFGLAGSLEGMIADAPAGGGTLTEAGAVVGTPAYMAPEQKAGQPADERADQYSLCLVWLEALGRDRAAPAADPGAARGPRGRIRTLMRGLAEDPARRWPDVAALLRALERRRTRGRVAIALAAAALVTAGAAGASTWRASSSAWSSSATAGESATGDPLVLGARKPGDPPWRMLLAGDGRTMIVSDGLGGLHLEDRLTGARAPLVLPAGRPHTRADVIAAASAEGDVVIVRMADRSVWRTGRDVARPILLRERGNGPVCLHPSGTRVAISAIDRDEPLELRAVDDGHLIATAPRGDLCAWSGDRLVLGDRVDAGARFRLRVVEDDGTTRDLPALAGQLSAIAADARAVVVAHSVGVAGGDLGLVSRLAIDGGAPPVPLRSSPSVKYGPVAITALGVFYGRVAEIDAVMIGERRAPDAPVDLRPLGSRRLRDGAAEWLDDDELAVGGHGELEGWRADGGGRTGWSSAPGLPLAHVGSEVLVAQPEAGSAQGATCAIRAIRASAAGSPRLLHRLPCATLATLRCDGQARCVLGVLDGPDVAFARFDPRSGAIAPVELRRPLSGTPHVEPATDGRWVVESGGAIELRDPGGASRPLPVPADVSVDNVVWDHDQQALLVTGTRAGDFVVLRLAPDGTIAVLARSLAGGFLAPRVSPDGRRLVVRQLERPFEYLLDPP